MMRRERRSLWLVHALSVYDPLGQRESEKERVQFFVYVSLNLSHLFKLKEVLLDNDKNNLTKGD